MAGGKADRLDGRARRRGATTATSSSCRGHVAFRRAGTTAIARFDPIAKAAGRRRADERGWDATPMAMRGADRGRLGSLPRPGRKARLTRVKADDAKCLIVGGGPAGLSAGLHLEDTDYPPGRQARPPGGLCRSIVQDGFTFDHAGHIFFTIDKYVDGPSATSSGTTSRAAGARAGSISTYATSAIRSRATSRPAARGDQGVLLGVIEASSTPGPPRGHPGATGHVAPAAQLPRVEPADVRRGDQPGALHAAL